MRKLILICCALVAFCFSGVLQAQNKAVKRLQPITYSSNVYDDLTSEELMFLSEIFKDKLKENVLDRPNMLLAYKNLLRNRIVIKQFNTLPTSEKYTNLNEIPLFTVYNSNLTRDVSYSSKTFKVLFDRKEGNYFIGRTEFDSPDVDNEVLVKADDTYIRMGDFANILITKTDHFDLYGVVDS